jgi:leader peptidase (prepilin peptidase) / N-methyltransferase
MTPAFLAMIGAYITIVGLCVGSFLNVVISRLPENLSIVRPSSRCPQCKNPIAWYDNLPVVSWLVLRARCRHCKKPIPARYPLVETLTAGVFAAFYVRFGLTWELAAWLPLAAALLAITFLDIDHWWVPDVITYPAMVFAMACSVLPGRLGIVQAALGLLPALLLWGVGFAFEKILGKEGLGFGDVKLLALLGLALGLRETMALLFLGAAQGAVIGSLLLLTGGHEQSKAGAPTPAALADDDWVPPARAIPFGPFLTLAAFEVVLLPDIFLGWQRSAVEAFARWVS